MALTLTVAQLSEAVRLTVSGSPAPPYLAIVTRQLAAATEIIEGYADWMPRQRKERGRDPACRLLAGQAADAQRFLPERLGICPSLPRWDAARGNQVSLGTSPPKGWVTARRYGLMFHWPMI